MNKWRQILARTRAVLTDGMSRLLCPRMKLGADEREKIEEILVSADVPAALAAELVHEAAEQRMEGNPRERVKDLLRRSIGEKVVFDWETLPHRPFVVMIVGVNGSGKTTTAAKLACRAKSRGLTVFLAAADTFRAAGSEQLTIWADRVGCRVISGAAGADPAAVAFDAVQSALARKADILFVDTAGRMHTKQPLMEELRKIRRAVGKSLPGAPHACWLTLDASLGTNSVMQARAFGSEVGVTGIVAAKLDGSAKAGFLASIRRELNIPVLFAGTGEQPEDLEIFDPEDFMEALIP